MSIGMVLRARREELGLTQDEVADRTGISKPYLSSIETGRSVNPPSEEKLRKLELALDFAPDQLVRMARLERAPKAVQDEIERLRAENRKFRSILGGSTNLDELYKAGKLAELAGQAASGEQAKPAHQRLDAGQWVPVINRVAAGYPVWTGDMDYPPGIADDYVRCPECRDPQAFAARVHGDSMEPRYHDGDIVIFSPAAKTEDGDDCFVRRADTHETTFKRVFTGEDGRLRLQPRNEKYAPQVLDREQVNGVYKAVFRVEKL
ncbi:MAG: S24 family peptidase [Phycisphaerae bacterium]|nr:S24 family peptidase [Phycisphaerae bacterium]